MSSNTAYKHRSLKTLSSTRVLQLAPAKTKKEPLQCQLLEVSLDQPPPYEAISYVWESQVTTSWITCNGAPLPITANADAALRRFRDKTQTKTLWIDSVCIDQATVHERNHQASIMDEIYERATNVLVWLGDGNTETDQLFRTLNGELLSHKFEKARLRLEDFVATRDPPFYVYYDMAPSLARPSIASRIKGHLLSAAGTMAFDRIDASLKRVDQLLGTQHAVLQIRPKANAVATKSNKQKAHSKSRFNCKALILNPNEPALRKDRNPDPKRLHRSLVQFSNQNHTLPDNLDLLPKANLACFRDHIMNQPWFHRMWTIQEVALASRGHFYCGTHSVPIDRLLDALDGVAITYNTNSSLNVVEGETSRLSRLEDLKIVSECLGLERALKEDGRYRKERQKLFGQLTQINNRLKRRDDLELLNIGMVKYLRTKLLARILAETRVPVSTVLANASRRGATEPRDKIFALYGLFKRMEVDMPVPDYDKTIEDIFTEATWVAINADQRLSVLLFVTGAPSEYCLPSWVPDWSDRSRAVIFDKHAARHFFASEDSSAPKLLENNVLEVTGRPINRIRTLCSSTFSRSSAESTMKHLDLTMLNWIAHFRTLKDFHDEDWINFCAALNYDSPNLAAKTEQATRDYMAILLLTRKLDITIEDYRRTHEAGVGAQRKRTKGSKSNLSKNETTSLVRYVRSTDSTDAWNFDRSRIRIAFEHREHLSRTLADMKLFWAFDRYIGVASMSVKAGDDIVLLAGLEVPAVLRHDNTIITASRPRPAGSDAVDRSLKEKDHGKGGSRFVSPAFIRGYMRGEAWGSLGALRNEDYYRLR